MSTRKCIYSSLMKQRYLTCECNSRQSVLAYGVSELGVKHVIVMGHYGCGGVAAAIASAPGGQVDAANGAVQGWIQPIREIFATSTR